MNKNGISVSQKNNWKTHYNPNKMYKHGRKANKKMISVTHSSYTHLSNSKKTIMLQI